MTANLVRALMVLGFIGVLVELILTTGCGPARNALADHAVTAPPRAVCQDGTPRCNGLVPEVCIVADEVGRWYPLHPRGDDLEPAPCAHRCVVDGTPAYAHCAGSLEAP